MTPEETREILREAMTPQQALALLKLAESAGAGLPADGVDEAVTALEKVGALDTISRMTWEYAVQLDYGKLNVAIGNNLPFYAMRENAASATQVVSSAEWTSSKQEAEHLKVSAEAHHRVPATIVCRLVTAPEVSP